MKLNVKNFTGQHYRILVKRNGVFLNALYHKTQYGVETLDRFFTVVMDNPDKEYTEYLQELLRKVEKHYNIELIKTPLEIAV